MRRYIIICMIMLVCGVGNIASAARVDLSQELERIDTLESRRMNRDALELAREVYAKAKSAGQRVDQLKALKRGIGVGISLDYSAKSQLIDSLNGMEHEFEGEALSHAIYYGMAANLSLLKYKYVGDPDKDKPIFNRRVKSILNYSDALTKVDPAPYLDLITIGHESEDIPSPNLYVYLLREAMKISTWYPNNSETLNLIYEELCRLPEMSDELLIDVNLKYYSSRRQIDLSRDDYYAKLEELEREYSRSDGVVMVKSQLIDRDMSLEYRKDSRLQDFERIDKLCREVKKRYPKSRHLNLIEQIIYRLHSQSGSINLPKQLYPNTPNEMSLDVRNVEQLTVELYKLNDEVTKSLTPNDRIPGVSWLNKNLIHKVDSLAKLGHIVESQKMTIKTELNKSITQKVMLHPKDLGRYLVVAKDSKGMTLTGNITSVSRIGVTTLRSGDRVIAYAVDFKTGEPFKKLSCDIYLQDGMKYQYTRRLESTNGLFDIVKRSDLKSQKSYTLIFDDGKGDRFNLCQNIYNSRPSSTSRKCRISTYTDRGTYRPGDTVRVHNVIYDPSKSLLSGLNICNRIDFPSGKTLDYRYGNSDEWGGVTSLIPIPSDVPSGLYRVTAWSNSKKADNNYVYIRVENYTRPTAEIKLKPLSRVYLPGERVTLHGSVSGYDGRSMEGVEVHYEVKQLRSYNIRTTNSVAKGSVKTNSLGEYNVEFASDTVKHLCIYEVTARMVDKSGETHEAKQKMWIIDTPYSLSMSSPKLLARSLAQPLTFHSTGYTTQSTGWSYKISKRGDKKSILSGKFNDRLPLDLPYDKLKDGLYEVELNAPHANSKSFEFQIYSDEQSSTPLNEELLELVVPKRKISSGDALRYFISTDRESIHALVTLSRGDSLLMSEVKHLGRALHECTIDYKPEFSGDLKLTVSTTLEGKNYTKYQNIEYYTPKDEIEVVIEGLPSEIIAPKAGALTLKVREKESQRGVRARLLVSIYDKSCDQIYEYKYSPLNKKSGYLGYISRYTECYDYNFLTLDFNRAKRNIQIRGISADGSNSADYEEEEDQPCISVGYGASKSVQKTGSISKHVRSNFRQTLLFRGNITTDENGVVRVPFKLSDLLTTYNVKVVAMTLDARSATTQGDFIATKKVMTSTLVPQFLRVGDIADLSTMAINRSNETVNATIKMEMFDPKSGKLYNNGVKNCILQPHSSKSISWSVTPAERAKRVGFKITLESPVATDIEQHIVEVDPAVERINIGELHYLGDEYRRFEIVPNDMVREGASNESMSLAYQAILPTVLRTVVVDCDTKPTTSTDFANRIYSMQIAHRMALKYSNSFYINVYKLTNSQAGKIFPDKVSFMNYIKGMRDHKVAYRKINLNRFRLEEFRNSDNGFSWTKGTPSSLMATLYIARVQSNELAGRCKYYTSKGLEANFEKTLGYLDNIMAKEFESSSSQRLTPQMLEYLELRSRSIKDGKQPHKAWSSYLDRIEAQWRKLNTYEMAQAALTLQRSGRNYSDLVELIKQQAVSYPHSGVTFPSGYTSNLASIVDGNIVAHTTIMKLMLTTGKDDDLVRDMFKWLMLQRKNQCWINSATSMEVIASMLDVAYESKIFEGQYRFQIIYPPKMVTSSLWVNRYLDMEMVKSGAAIKVVDYSQKDVHKAPAFAELCYSYDVSLKDIKSNNSGFEISREVLTDGTPKLGDVVKVRYTIKSDNNVNMVKVRTIKSGAYEPRNNKSGYQRGYYRNVQKGGIDYYFDLIPRGETTFEEEYLVWYSGEFSDGYAVVESLSNAHLSGNSSVERISVERPTSTHSEVKLLKIEQNESLQSPNM